MKISSSKTRTSPILTVGKQLKTTNNKELKENDGRTIRPRKFSKT